MDRRATVDKLLQIVFDGSATQSSGASAIGYSAAKYGAHDNRSEAHGCSTGKGATERI
jgi:hypothetical protein